MTRPTHLARVDMGPDSVDGWLAGLVGKELGAEEGPAIELDADSRELRLRGEPIALRPLEFGFIAYLVARPGKVVARHELMEAVWGYEADTSSNVIEAVVRTLRKKLGQDAELIETVRGIGYRYRPDG